MEGGGVGGGENVTCILNVHSFSASQPPLTQHPGPELKKKCNVKQEMEDGGGEQRECECDYYMYIPSGSRPPLTKLLGG